MSSVLGPGALVLPGLAARVAGPASLIAWAILALASLPFALTFSSLSARRPESGGVYAFAREAFGPTAATVVAWLVGLWMAVGAPAVALIAGSYLGYAFGLTRPESYLFGFTIVAVAFALNLRGIRLSAQVQLAVVTSILALMAVTIATSGVRVNPGNFVPFAPEGLFAIGTAAALVFWAFLGYENVSNVAAEFENPKRDFPRAVALSVGVVGSLYFVLAIVIVGTGAYRTGGGVAPFAAILGSVLGPLAAAGAALFATFIVFATVNAYTTGMSRVVYAAALDGAFPRTLALLDPRTQVPGRALAGLFIAAAGVMTLLFALQVDLQTVLLIASGPAILVYVFGSAAGVRLHRRTGMPARRLVFYSAISLAISLLVVPFLGWYLLPTAVVVLTAVAFDAYGRRTPSVSSG